MRGYVSKIDGSVQPYGLVIPASDSADPDRPRGSTSGITAAGKHSARFPSWRIARRIPASSRRRTRSSCIRTGAIAMPIDSPAKWIRSRRWTAFGRNMRSIPNRVLVRGFSMGGAACWMFATHHAGLWAAAAPGAGFTETAHFLHIADLNSVPWYQRKLWHWYDSIDYAMNLYNCPVVAYSGAADPQKQAADEMDKAMAAVGLHLEHVIGPGNTKHFYHPAAKIEVSRRIDLIADHGREPMPSHLKFVTWTLKYNRMRWLQVDGLGASLGAGAGGCGDECREIRRAAHHQQRDGPDACV